MAERPAVNASPLILLAGAGRLPLLRVAGPEVVVPAAVAREVRRAGPDDPAVRALVSMPWLMGIPARGTLGIVLVARKRGLLPAARPVLEEMRRAGMYLSDRVLNRALALVGE